MVCLLLSFVGCARQPAPAACPPLDVEPAPAAAQALEERLAALADAGTITTVTITETEASAYLRYRMLADGTSDARIIISAHALCAQASAPILGRHLTIVAELFPTSSEGRLHVAVPTLAVDGRPLPGLLRRSFQSMLNELLAELGVPGIIRHVTLSEGSLTLQLDPQSAP